MRRWIGATEWYYCGIRKSGASVATMLFIAGRLGWLDMWEDDILRYIFAFFLCGSIRTSTVLPYGAVSR